MSSVVVGDACVAAVVALVRVYQRLLSPFLGENCRFSPTCSQYAVEVVRKYGVVMGLGYALWRIVRCQPLCRGGYDPVP